MSTQAQISANQANAQHSTGPTSAEGVARSSINHLRHGLAGAFRVLRGEQQEEYDELLNNLRVEHSPSTPTAALLVERMAQHYWLSRRAIQLQDLAVANDFVYPEDSLKAEDAKRLALYMRYQVTHERAFHKCLADLLKLRAEKRKAEIGFESQQQKKAAEDRRQELHKWAVSLAEAKLDRKLPNTSKVAKADPKPQQQAVTVQNAA